MTDTCRYRIVHRTVYRYSDPVTSSYGRGYLTPRDTDVQRVLTTDVRVDPEPADASTGVDVWGNRDLYFHVTQPHDTLVVTAESEVEVAGSPAVGAADVAWETARPDDSVGALAVDFVLDLEPPEIDAAVIAYAAPSFPPGRPLREAVVDLTHRIFTDFTYCSGSTLVSTRVAEVLASRSGVCQDFARLAIACLRANGLAARYVSGYLATDPPPGKERMVGVDATHAWAAVWMPGDVWLAFDPTNDQLVDERYTTVAWGRDYADVPPLRGVIYTEAKDSTIEVSVDVAPVPGDADA
ncbi:transglutaminase family protein [Rhodococcus gannanensis]|uniref:Transglutaminase N-terminal domain-containing protein n=1 Tax=Rhodococcus gannanensis TaxID=1960308 RepID=A0ABW4P3E4_9NOCA